ncbi:MAG: hypothetical protein IT377_18885 [Polyangiaceae bacterium]|nr:hypothetical protein [Polyangiaceae bacterium]
MKRRAAHLVRVRSWLLPTLVGPSLGALLFVVGHGLASGASLAKVVAELVASCVLGAVLGAVLSLVDFGLLVARLRTPPTSGRAWLSSALAGAGAVLLWRWLRPSLLSAPSSHLVALLLAVIVSALVVRVITGQRPSGWLRFS